MEEINETNFEVKESVKYNELENTEFTFVNTEAQLINLIQILA
jgi:hypothetical protein